MEWSSIFRSKKIKEISKELHKIHHCFIAWLCFITWLLTVLCPKTLCKNITQQVMLYTSKCCYFHLVSFGRPCTMLSFFILATSA